MTIMSSKTARTIFWTRLKEGLGTQIKSRAITLIKTITKTNNKICNRIPPKSSFKTNLRTMDSPWTPSRTSFNPLLTLCITTSICPHLLLRTIRSLLFNLTWDRTLETHELIRISKFKQGTGQEIWRIIWGRIQRWNQVFWEVYWGSFYFISPWFVVFVSVRLLWRLAF